MSARSGDLRATIIRVFTFIGGLYFFLYFVCPDSLIEWSGIKTAHEPISNGFIVVGSMAIGLGLINIISAHGLRVLFKRKGWPYSVALMTGLVATLIVTIGQWISSREISREVRDTQVIGDFAARIIEDGATEPGATPRPKSVSPSGELPPLSARVNALLRYSDEQLLRMNQYREAGMRHRATDQVYTTLVAELGAAAAALQESAGRARELRWEALGAEQKAALEEIARRAAKLSSTFSIVRRKDSGEFTIQKLYSFLYEGVFTSLGSAMFALLGVYIAAAAYRAFRIRTVESALMMTAALIVMLGQISFGRLLYEDMPAVRQWLLEVPNSAAFRAIRLGAGVAGLMLAIRMWLSIESGSFSARKRE